MLKYNKEIIIGILLLIGVAIICDSAITYDKNIPKEEIKWQGIDTWAFGDAFNYMHVKHGKGHVFEWRGNKYKVILKEDI